MFKRLVGLFLCGTIMVGLNACQPSQSQPTATVQATASITTQPQPSPTQLAQRSATPAPVPTTAPLAPTEVALASLTTEPTSEPTSTPREAVIEPLPDPILISEPLPSLMQTTLDPPVSFSLNDQTTYANPAQLPERSAETINLASLANLSLLQKIGLGEVVDVGIAPNNQFIAIATTINVVVYELPSLQQRYVAQVPATIYNLSISDDSATINLLLNPDLIAPAPAKATLRQYASQTGAFIAETELMVDVDQWDTSEPLLENQSIPNHTGGYGAYSPDQAFFAQLEPPPGLAIGLGVAIERVVDQRIIYTDEESLHLRFSLDSQYAVVFFEKTIRIIELNTTAVQTLVIPAYTYGNFSPDNTLYATGDGFQLLDVNQARIFKTFPNQPIDSMYRTYTRPTFSLDGQLISNGENIWSVMQTNRLIRQQILPFFGDVASGIAITHINGDYVLMSEKLYTQSNEPLELKLLQAGQIYTVFTVTHTLNDVYFTPYDMQIAFIFDDNALYFYDIASNSFIQHKVFPYPLKEVSFSNDGNQMVVSFEENPQSIMAALLNRNDLSIVRTFGAVEGQFAIDYDNVRYQSYRKSVPIQIVNNADFMIIPVNLPDHTAIVYRLSDGMPMYRIKQGMLSPDNRLYLAIEGGQIQLWGMRQ